VVPPWTDQNRRTFAAAIAWHARFYANRIRLVASAILSRNVQPRWRDFSHGRFFFMRAQRGQYTLLLVDWICAIITIDYVDSAGVRRTISELVIYVDQVALATSCSPINNSSDPVAWGTCMEKTVLLEYLKI